MTLSFWTKTNPLAMKSTEIAIVGGGFVGLSTAYWIKELRPDVSVTVLERRECGEGASGRNAGFLTKGSASFYKTLQRKWGKDHAQKICIFAQDSINQTFTHLIKDQLPGEETSSLTLFQSEDHYRHWEEVDFIPNDYSFEWRENPELPADLVIPYFGALESSPEYKINPKELIRNLREKVIARGVKILENVTAFELDPRGIRTDQSFLEAQKVILAINGYASQFHPQLSVISPLRAQMLAVKLESPIDCPALHYDPSDRVYWRTTEDDVLIIGGKRLMDEAREVGEYETITTVIQDALESYLTHVLRLKFSPIKRWSGIMGFTDDELPIVEKVYGPLETYLIAGFSGHGMGLGFNSAREMAQLALGSSGETLFSSLRTTEIYL